MKKEVELIDYIRVVWKRKVLIILMTIFSIFAVVVANLLLPSVYETSLDLEVGKCCSIERTIGRIYSKIIEEPDAISFYIQNYPFLARVAKKLNSGLLPYQLKEMVKTRVEERKIPLPPLEPVSQVNITVKGKSPKEVMRVINCIAEVIIQEHRRKFDELMKPNQQYERNLKNNIAAITQEIQEMKKTLAYLSKRHPVDAPAVIVLQSELVSRERVLQDLNRELHTVQSAIIMSTNTKIKNPSIEPKSPVKSNMLLNVIVAAVVGLMVALGLAFFLEYLQKVGEREQEKE
ncbi:MAG: Wzz/FepE/Etk N-terminal domain-containing protein [bacterium]